MPRRGCLKNGNPSGDYLKSLRCGARTRAGCGRRQQAMANGRRRLHGGLSTGPRTPEGLARCRTTRLKHGCRSRELIGLRRRAVHAARRLRSLTHALSAGHGVLRSDSARNLPVTDAPKQGTGVGPYGNNHPAGLPPLGMGSIAPIRSSAGTRRHRAAEPPPPPPLRASACNHLPAPPHSPLGMGSIAPFAIISARPPQRPPLGEPDLPDRPQHDAGQRVTATAPAEHAARSRSSHRCAAPCRRRAACRGRH
jgi:hypothetical protein